MAMYRKIANHAETVDLIPASRPIAFTGPGPFGTEYPRVVSAYDYLAYSAADADTYGLYQSEVQANWELVP